MQIGAINSTNFKGYNPEIIDIPQEDYEVISYEFDSDIDKFEKATEITDKLINNEQKGIIATGATILGYAGKSFIKGASAIGGADSLFGNKISVFFEKGLKKASNFIQGTAQTLKTKEGKKLSKLANITGKGLEKAEQLARKSYKALSATTKEITEKTIEGDNIKEITKKVKSHEAGKGLAMVAGIISALALVPGLLKKDDNEDGIPDFKQKSQKVFAKNSQVIDKIGEQATIVAEAVQLIAP